MQDTPSPSQENDHPPFYGHTVLRDQQQAYIRQLLRKYRNDPPSEALKEKIWNELQLEKFHGRVTIPFKVVMRSDKSNHYPSYIEVILDSKV